MLCWKPVAGPGVPAPQVWGDVRTARRVSVPEEVQLCDKISLKYSCLVIPPLFFCAPNTKVAIWDMCGQGSSLEALEVGGSVSTGLMGLHQGERGEAGHGPRGQRGWRRASRQDQRHWQGLCGSWALGGFCRVEREGSLETPSQVPGALAWVSPPGGKGLGSLE